MKREDALQMLSVVAVVWVITLTVMYIVQQRKLEAERSKLLQSERWRERLSWELNARGMPYEEQWKMRLPVDGPTRIP